MITLPFADARMDRASPAWNPDTGAAVPEHVARFSDQLRILESLQSDHLYHNFDDTVGFVDYGEEDCATRPGETTHHYLEELAQWEDRVGMTKWNIANSYQGRPVPVYRLGPADRQHFCITGVMHGNEVDGHLGTLKGMELVATHPDFAKLREEHTLFFMPVMNPDGYYLQTRYCAQTDATGAPTNMNRNFPYYWEEYVPSPTEGKGDYPLDLPETAALHNYLVHGNNGPVPFRFVLDVHSTVGDGTRYQSRDRTYHNYDEGDWFSIWADLLIWYQARGLQARRVVEQAHPDLYTRLYRSRYRPHWHPWLQTRSKGETAGVAPISLVVEHNKVAYQDLETYQSANNYNVDYITACATVMQGGAYRKRAAVLVEGLPAENRFDSPAWDAWQPDEWRPGWWTFTRSKLVGTLAREQRFLDYQGKALRIEADCDLSVPAGVPLEYGAACVNYNGEIAWYLAGGSLCETEQTTYGAECTEVASGLAAGNANHGLIYRHSSELWILGGGDGCWPLQYDSGTATWSLGAKVPFPGGAVVQDPACAYSYPYAYIAGGTDGNPSALTSIYRLKVTDGTISLWATLDTGVAAACAFIDGDDLHVLGGHQGGAATTLHQVIDLTTGVCSSATPTAPASLDGGFCHAAFYFDGSTVYLYGGESRPSSPYAPGYTIERIAGVHAYDLATQTWTVAEVVAEVYDSEDIDGGSYGPVLSTYDHMRACAAPMTPPDENGVQVYIFGDDQGDPAIFVHDVLDNMLTPTSDAWYGYLRHNSRLPCDEQVLADEDFDGQADTYTDVTGNCTQNADHIVGSAVASSTLRWGLAAGKYRGVLLRIEMAKNGAGDHQTMVVRLKGHQGDDHYQVTISASQVEITRETGSSTVLATIAGGIIDEAVASFEIGVLEDPSHIIIWKDGSRVGWVDDWRPARIAGDRGKVELELTASGGSTQIELHAAQVCSWSAEEQRSCASWMVRNINDVSDLMIRSSKNVYDYARRWDDITRYAREYYFGPPGWWYRTHSACDLAGGITSHIEHGFRAYCRFYRHGDQAEVDAPMLNIGSCLPMSWLPSGVQRPAERLSWSGMPIDRIDLAISWVPLGPIPSYEQDVELLRLEVDASNYLALILIVGDRWEREHNRGDFYSCHEPRLRLVKVHSGAQVASCELVAYWSKLNGTGQDRFEETLQLRLWHDAALGFGLQLRRGCRLGQAFACDLQSLGATGELIISGSGWWAEPELDADQAGRALPLHRSSARQLTLRHEPYGAVLAGDLDPLTGTTNDTNPYDWIEDFSRPSDPNLGSRWDIIDDRYGWDLWLDRARCDERGGIERWDADPKLRDCTVHAEIRLDGDATFGLFHSMDWSDASYGRIFAYELRTTNVSGTLTVEILLLYHDGSAQQEEVLATTTATASSSYPYLTVTFGRDGDQLTGTVFDDADVQFCQVQATEGLLRRPGAFGIRGEATSSIYHVDLYRVWATTPHRRRL